MMDSTNEQPQQHPIMVVDIDGTLAKVLPDGINILRQRDGLPLLLPPRFHSLADYSSADMGYCFAAFKERDVYDVSPPYECAAILLHELALDYEPVYCTSRCSGLVGCDMCSTKGIRQSTQEWLFKHGFPTGTILFTASGQEKATLIKALYGNRLGGSISIEDRYDDAAAYAEIGLTSFLLRRPYNLVAIKETNDGETVLADLVPIFEIADITPFLNNRVIAKAEFIKSGLFGKEGAA